MCYSETYRAVFSDIDGTLLTSQKNVSPDTVNAILKLSLKDILFTLSSARSPAGIETVIRQYGFSCCIVAFSGALILDEKRKVLFEKGIAFFKIHARMNVRPPLGAQKYIPQGGNISWLITLPMHV